ncbi:Uncharacterised protein [Bordetella pertussis]|nr:Uncharacterised protein [Bordetella pertussis]
MMPCSSGNSPTMFEPRSALASSAARSQWAASPPSAVAMPRAMARTRSTRSSWVPSLLW